MWHFYLFYLNCFYRWNFVVYIQMFDFLVILNDWFYFSKKNKILWLTFKCFKAFLFEWKIMAYLCSGLLKKRCTGGISIRIFEFWLCQMNPRWLAFHTELNIWSKSPNPFRSLRLLKFPPNLQNPKIISWIFKMLMELFLFHFH